ARGAREVALGHHLVEHPQQVEVQGAEIRLLYHDREWYRSRDSIGNISGKTLVFRHRGAPAPPSDKENTMTASFVQVDRPAQHPGVSRFVGAIGAARRRFDATRATASLLL